MHFCIASNAHQLNSPRSSSRLAAAECAHFFLLLLLIFVCFYDDFCCHQQSASTPRYWRCWFCFVSAVSWRIFVCQHFAVYINEVPCLSLSFQRAKNALEKAKERRKEGREGDALDHFKEKCLCWCFFCLLNCMFLLLFCICLCTVCAITDINWFDCKHILTAATLQFPPPPSS